MNQIVKTTAKCVHHSVEPQPLVCQPVSNRFVDDLLVRILPACAHSVFEIV